MNNHPSNNNSNGNGNGNGNYNTKLKVVVIGGSGLIGKKLVHHLTQAGHEAVAASPSKGVNALTGEGLNEVLVGADVVVDVSNSPSFEDKAVFEFFNTSTRNLLAAEAAAGVKHHVALSVVGTDRLQASGYFRAKQDQETQIQSSPLPYSIVRATQFYEFVAVIAHGSTQDEKVHLPAKPAQAIYSDDVALILADVAASAPLNQIIDIAGPDRTTLDQLVRDFLKATGDSREVVTDAKATYFGTPLDEHGLAPAGEARLGKTGFAEWLSRQGAQG